MHWLDLINNCWSLFQFHGNTLNCDLRAFAFLQSLSGELDWEEGPYQVFLKEENSVLFSMNWSFIVPSGQTANRRQNISLPGGNFWLDTRYSFLKADKWEQTLWNQTCQWLEEIPLSSVIHSPTPGAKRKRITCCTICMSSMSFHVLASLIHRTYSPCLVKIRSVLGLDWTTVYYSVQWNLRRQQRHT